MAVHIDNLHVTVRVRTRPRTVIGEKEDRLPRAPATRIHLLPPPKPQPPGEVPVPLGSEEPETLAFAVEQVELSDLTERVYDILRDDVRVDRERRGQPR